MTVTFKELKDLGIDLKTFCSVKGINLEEVYKTDLNNIKLNTEEFKTMVNDDIKTSEI